MISYSIPFLHLAISSPRPAARLGAWILPRHNHEELPLQALKPLGKHGIVGCFRALASSLGDETVWIIINGPYHLDDSNAPYHYYGAEGDIEEFVTLTRELEVEFTTTKFKVLFVSEGVDKVAKLIKSEIIDSTTFNSWMKEMVTGVYQNWIIRFH